jgi:hypothetical protein
MPAKNSEGWSERRVRKKFLLCGSRPRFGAWDKSRPEDEVAVAVRFRFHRWQEQEQKEGHQIQEILRLCFKSFTKGTVIGSEPVSKI